MRDDDFDDHIAASRRRSKISLWLNGVCLVLLVVIAAGVWR